MKLRIRYIALALLIAAFIPNIRELIEWLGVQQSRYEMGVAVEEAAEVMLAYNLPMGEKK